MIPHRRAAYCRAGNLGGRCSGFGRAIAKTIAVERS